jgi:hypothetical protein
MISADPTVPDPMNAQAWNRYSYVGNDPLAFTDPSGFSWLSSFFHSIEHAISSAWHSITHFFATNAIARAILQIGLNFILSPLGPIGAAISAAVVVGLSGGNLGQVLRAGAIAGATALAFYEVGNLTNEIAGEDPSAAHIQPKFGTEAYAFNVAGHALVGCASSAASGASCQSGALSAGVTAGAGPLINGPKGLASLVANSVLGGVASVAGGGKFANGAVTAAFGYMYNATMHIGGSAEVPGLVAEGVTAAYRWFTGDESFVMGNSIGGGVVIQYTGATDRVRGTTVPYVGFYGQGATPVGSAETFNLELSGSGELGVGTGSIHGNFDGPSFNYSGMFGAAGGTATFSSSPNGDLAFSGLAVKVGAGLGVSASGSFTGAYTARDVLFGYGH